MMTPPCWICGSPGLEVVRASRIPGQLSSKEFAITDSTYGVTGELSRCPACGFMQCSELTDVMGYDAQGVEPSEWLCTRGREQGLRIHRGVFPHPDVTGFYDVVTLVDVLEHVSNPVGLLRDM